jgi:hypothetical protein
MSTAKDVNDYQRSITGGKYLMDTISNTLLTTIECP